MQKITRHPLLSKASPTALPTMSVTVAGTKYQLRLLRPEGEAFVAVHMAGETPASAILTSVAPTIAAALVSMAGEDGTEVPVEQLFKPEQPIADVKVLRDWLREQVLDWLREDMDPTTVDALWGAYREMTREHQKTMAALGNPPSGSI